MCDKRDRAITWEFCGGLPLTLMFSGLVQNDLFQGRCSLAKRFFETKLLSRLSHNVCCLLSSPVLLRELTTINEESMVRGSTSGDGKEKRGENLSFAFLLPITLRAPFGHASRVSFPACDSHIVINK